MNCFDYVSGYRIMENLKYRDPIKFPLSSIFSPRLLFADNLGVILPEKFLVSLSILPCFSLLLSFLFPFKPMLESSFTLNLISKLHLFSSFVLAFLLHAFKSLFAFLFSECFHAVFEPFTERPFTAFSFESFKLLQSFLLLLFLPFGLFVLFSKELIGFHTFYILSTDLQQCRLFVCAGEHLQEFWPTRYAALLSYLLQAFLWVYFSRIFFVHHSS